MITSRYGYIVWSVAILTAWLSFVLSIWLGVEVEARYLFVALFWLIVAILMAILPAARGRQK